jgi:hypothetical protein
MKNNSSLLVSTFNKALTETIILSSRYLTSFLNIHLYDIMQKAGLMKTEKAPFK